MSQTPKSVILLPSKSRVIIYNFTALFLFTLIAIPILYLYSLLTRSHVTIGEGLFYLLPIALVVTIWRILYIDYTIKINAGIITGPYPSTMPLLNNRVSLSCKDCELHAPRNRSILEKLFNIHKISNSDETIILNLYLYPNTDLNDIISNINTYKSTTKI